MTKSSSLRSRVTRILLFRKESTPSTRSVIWCEKVDETRFTRCHQATSGTNPQPEIPAFNSLSGAARIARSGDFAILPKNDLIGLSRGPRLGRECEFKAVELRGQNAGCWLGNARGVVAGRDAHGRPAAGWFSARAISDSFQDSLFTPAARQPWRCEPL